MDCRNIPLKELLRNREVFAVFDEEFHKATWLDVTVLLESEGTLGDLYEDDMVQPEVLDAITERLKKFPRRVFKN